MRIGINAGASSGPDSTLDAVVKLAQECEERGFHAIWMAQFFAMDATTALAVVGRETRRIELGTAVLPTYPRHPMFMAQQALTAGVAANGRFTLGIGLSHQIVIEQLMGLDYSKPARHMREYLEVLAPLLRGEKVAFAGDCYRVNAEVKVEGAKRVPLIVAALGPVMLGLAGRFADGTITWMTGVKTLRDHVVPTLRAAAEEAERPAPRVVCGLPVIVTDRPEELRGKLASVLQMYGGLPSYRAMLDREGAEGPADVAILGSEAEVGAALDELEAAGVTDLNASILTTDADERERTLALLAARL
jgi:F420-dependent oxidoreductase-like protein